MLTVRSGPYCPGAALDRREVCMSTSTCTWRNSLAAVLIAVVGLSMWGAPAAAKVATGNVAGTVKDEQGGVIPGATVSLVSQTRGTVTDTVSNTEGDFVFVNVP